MIYPFKIGDFPLKAGDLPLKTGVSIKNWCFFPLKTCDFPLKKTCVFSIKNWWFSIKHWWSSIKNWWFFHSKLVNFPLPEVSIPQRHTIFNMDAVDVRPSKTDSWLAGPGRSSACRFACTDNSGRRSCDKTNAGQSMVGWTGKLIHNHYDFMVS